jgi:endonuclease YncB( thermonuclease family)
VTATSRHLHARCRHGRRLLCGGAALVLAVTAPALADISGPPRIIDGRTLEVAGQRIRLFGIDVPDVDQVCQHGGRDYQCGRVARAALWDLVAGLDVSCAPETEVSKEDGSMAATCTAGGFSLNESMVHGGWALADRGATDRYVATETDARDARRGLWKGEFEPPWEWRQAHARGDAGDDAGASAR